MERRGGVRMQILLVEDNKSISKALKYNLEQHNYRVLIAENLKEAKQLLETQPLLGVPELQKTKKLQKAQRIDLIILDVTLPDGNGFDFYKEIKEKYGISTIFLTAKDEENDVVRGLELGAEDYVTKPFSTRELLARINKILLRSKKKNRVTIQDITCDLDKMCISKQGEEINFSSLELKILMLLFTNLNKVITREYIIEKIWDWTGNDVYDNTVTVYMKRIRQKLGSPIITTVKGVGYRIDEE